MNPIQLHSAVEQVALHLKNQIVQGEIRGEISGASQLASMLGVNAKTAESALGLLEKEGVLLSQGPRRRRLVNSKGVGERRESGREHLHFGILLYESSDRHSSVVTGIQHALNEAGHVVTLADKTLTELQMNLSRVKRMVHSYRVDAWIVVAGSREVLGWFSGQELPAFALFGRRNRVSLPSIGPNSERAFAAGVDYLITQGHQRIVRICRSERRKPSLGQTERELLKTLKAHKIPTGEYNLPDWEETPEGFQALLESLFLVTPPTALIVDDVCYFTAALQFLAGKGLRVPEDVSIIVGQMEPSFDWCQPPLAHLRWDRAVVARRVVQWASKVKQGKVDIQRSSVPSEFVMGGTVGPVATSL